MSNTFSIQVKLDNKTLEALHKGSYQLQLFRGVEAASVTEGKPTVWAKMDQFANTVVVSFDEKAKVKGYFQASTDNQLAKISSTVSKSMVAGEVITLKQDGEAVVGHDGIKDAFLLLSENTEKFSSGLSIDFDGQSAAICTFPQYSTEGNLLSLTNNILVVISNVQRDVGAAVETLLATSVLVDFSLDTPKVELSYDILTGWGKSSVPNVSIQPVNTNIAQLLITPSKSLGTTLLKMSK